MQTITLEIQDPEILEMLIGLANKLNLRIIERTNDDSLERSRAALNIMRNIAAQGSLKKVIPDPVAWQKEIRKDRLLPGRE